MSYFGIGSPVQAHVGVPPTTARGDDVIVRGDDVIQDIVTCIGNGMVLQHSDLWPQ